MIIWPPSESKPVGRGSLQSVVTRQDDTALTWPGEPTVQQPPELASGELGTLWSQVEKGGRLGWSEKACPPLTHYVPLAKFLPFFLDHLGRPQSPSL